MVKFIFYLMNIGLVHLMITSLIPFDNDDPFNDETNFLVQTTQGNMQG